MSRGFVYEGRPTLRSLQQRWPRSLREVVSCLVGACGFSGRTCESTDVVQISRPPRMSFWKSLFSRSPRKDFMDKLSDKRFCSNVDFLLCHPEYKAAGMQAGDVEYACHSRTLLKQTCLLQRTKRKNFA